MVRILALLLTIVWPIEPPPLYDGPINEPASATVPAERLDPPITVPVIPVIPAFSGDYANGRCVGAEPLLDWFSPGWDTIRMSRIMYRESRCKPAVRNRSGSTGLLQIMPSNCPYIADQMGEPCSVARLTDPIYNVRAAVELWQYDRYGPWAT